jgi:hypothetical protein
VKGEAAALSVRAQRCQSHYFSSTPRKVRFSHQLKLIIINSYLQLLHVQAHPSREFQRTHHTKALVTRTANLNTDTAYRVNTECQKN